MIINNDNENDSNTAIEDYNNNPEHTHQNEEQCFFSFYVIIVNQNKTLIKGRSLTDTLSEL